MVSDGSPAPERHEDAVPAATEQAQDEQLRFEARVEGRSLQVLRKSFVKPATPTPPENRWLRFSNLDLTWLQFYSSVICLYRANTANAAVRETVGEHLRTSLERALALFYPLAGRVVMPKEQLAPGTVCDDSGAVLVEACIDAVLDDLQYEYDFQPSFRLSGMAEAGLAEYPRLPEDPAGRPALIVQVTHFKCGGITLAANWAHPVADGFSGFHFMKSWAELAREEEVSLLPVHDRTLVKPREPLILSDPFSEHYSSEFSSISSVTVSNPEPNQSKCTVQTVEIAKQLVAELKQEVESEASQTRLSRACCVSAHAWRALVKARGLPGTDLTRMWTIVEGRKKLGLPAGYFGNVIQCIVTTTTVNTLLNKPLAYSASLIAATIQHTSKDWFQDVVDWEEAKQFRPYPGQILGPDHECGISWLNRFPLYELDFGFGAPVCTTRNSCGAWDGYLVILPSSRGPDNFTAVCHTTPDVMKRFLPLLLHSSS